MVELMQDQTSKIMRENRVQKRVDTVGPPTFGGCFTGNVVCVSHSSRPVRTGCRPDRVGDRLIRAVGLGG